jgi:uncharacterized protein (TIGR04255 family)
MTENAYKRAPITEAVVELRLAAPLPIELVEKVKTQLTDDYPLAPQIMQSITVRTGPVPQPSIEFAAYRMFSADATSVAIIGRQVFSASRLAPYSGWEAFIGRAQLNWAVWKKIVGWREVIRLGVRYINRIDVSNPEDRPIPIDDFLIFRPVFPTFEGSQGVDSFAINGSMPIANSQFRLILNAGSTVSPLVKTTSFLLDLDISQEIDLPKSDDALWSLIDQIREVKNRIFEASITDSARRLFSS